MTRLQMAPAGIPAHELEHQNVEYLPDREAMSLVNANIAVPINVALAANVLSDNAVAIAEATQSGDIEQGILGGGLDGS